jgi:mannose-6-phosphate isomerase-like protein (cupin superfamily)
MNSREDPLPIVHRSAGDPGRTQTLGPYRIEALLDRHEAGAGTVWRVRIGPGERTSVSYHRIAEEYYFVLAGDGLAVLDGREVRLKPGDFLRLPPGTTHGFVAGPEGLEMLDIHTPGCWPDHDTYFVDTTPEGFGPAVSDAS